VNRSTRIGLRLAWGFTLLAGGALPALGDWTVPLSGAARGLNTVTLERDGVGGVLPRWIDLQGQIYEKWVQAGHLDALGAPYPSWSAPSFMPGVFLSDIDVAPDGSAGAIFVVKVPNPAANLWAHRILADGTSDPSWPSVGVGLLPPGPQDRVRAVTDGAGGAFVAWRDQRDGTPAAYLTRVTNGGTIAAGWPSTGRLVGAWPANGNQFPELRSDGAGGVIVGLIGSDAQLFRIAADGTAAPGWSDAGLLVTTTAAAPFGPRLAIALAIGSDGGTYLSWTEGVGNPLPLRSAPVRALRVTPEGTLDSRWPAGGLAFGPGSDSLSDPSIVTGASNDVYVVWGALSPDGARALRAVRISDNGSVAPGWSPSGIDLLEGAAAFALDNSIYESDDPAVFAAGPDGAGGLFVAWDDRGLLGTTQVRVTRFRADGTRHAGWLAGGHLIPAAYGNGRSRAILGDGSGDAFVVWRSISNFPFGSSLISRAMPDALIDVPQAPTSASLGLVNESGNPARGGLTFTCTLTGASPGRLELYDVSGRRLRSRRLDGSAGPRRVVLARSGDLPSGVLFARLAQGEQERWLRIVVAR
jgi:hypothetical protein